MPITKSELVKQLSKTYPNLLKKDLEKFFDIFINEVKLALKTMRELNFAGGVFFQPKIKKAKLQEIQKLEKKL